MGIETILFCFIADEEMFTVENRFASGELMTTIQKTAQAAASKKIEVCFQYIVFYLFNILHIIDNDIVVYVHAVYFCRRRRLWKRKKHPRLLLLL